MLVTCLVSNVADKERTPAPPSRLKTGGKEGSQKDEL